MLIGDVGLFVTGRRVRSVVVGDDRHRELADLRAGVPHVVLDGDVVATLDVRRRVAGDLFDDLWRQGADSDRLRRLEKHQAGDVSGMTVRQAGHQVAATGGTNEQIRASQPGNREQGLEITQQLVHTTAAGCVGAAADAGAVVGTRARLGREGIEHRLPLLDARLVAGFEQDQWRPVTRALEVERSPVADVE